MLLKNNKDLIYNKKKERLNNKLEELQKLKKEYIIQFKEQQTKLSNIQSNLDIILNDNKSLTNDISLLTEEENKSENKGMIDKLKNLVFQNEKLKKEEELFRQECKENINEYNNKIDKLTELLNNTNDIETNKIKEMYLNANKKYNLVRQALAEKNQEIAQVKFFQGFFRQMRFKLQILISPLRIFTVYFFL